MYRGSSPYDLERYIPIADAAKLLRISPYRVSKIFDKGLLKGHILPATKIRRIYRSSVEQMARELGLTPETTREP